MSRFRRLPPSYWVMVSVLMMFGGLFFANFLLDWGQGWIQLAFPIVTLVTCAYVYRMLWKQSDPAAARSGPSGEDAEPPA